MLTTFLCNGEFVSTSLSSKPGMVISKNLKHDNNNKALISIHEYRGDYISVNINDIDISNIDNYEKLSILAGFGEWFYEQHKDLYQEHIINTLLYR
tara:strand:+ start:11969 stop:12256 length:288 start_codon:yes stop_codon:yes gene_type:complete